MHDFASLVDDVMKDTITKPVDQLQQIAEEEGDDR